MKVRTKIMSHRQSKPADLEKIFFSGVREFLPQLSKSKNVGRSGLPPFFIISFAYDVGGEYEIKTVTPLPHRSLVINDKELGALRTIKYALNRVCEFYGHTTPTHNLEKVFIFIPSNRDKGVVVVMDKEGYSEYLFEVGSEPKQLRAGSYKEGFISFPAYDDELVLRFGGVLWTHLLSEDKPEKHNEDVEVTLNM